MNLLPLLLWVMCATGVVLVLAGQRDPLRRRINSRISAIRGGTLDDATMGSNLRTRFHGWDRIPFGTIHQEACLVEGTIRPFQALVFSQCLLVVTVIALWFGDWRWAAAAAVVGLVAGRRAIRFVANRNRKQFLQHFPAYLDRIRKLVESGNSLDVAMKKALSYANPRVAQFIAPALKRHKLGMPVATALDMQAKKLGLAEISQLALVAYVIARYGGSLSDSMAHIAQVERNRARADREMEALTAEVRASAKVFVALPLLVAGAIFAIHPSYVTFFFDDRSGPLILAYCAISIMLGIAVMRRMSRIE